MTGASHQVTLSADTGRQAIFPSIHLLMPSISKGGIGTIF